MKIAYLTLLIIILIGCTDQKASITNVIKTDFNNRISNASDLIWESEEDGYEIEFNISGVPGSVNYDLKGNWTETEHDIDILLLPKPISHAIAQKYDGFDITAAESIVTPEMEGYEIEISSKEATYEVVYLTNAEFVMQKSDGPKEEH